MKHAKALSLICLLILSYTAAFAGKRWIPWSNPPPATPLFFWSLESGTYTTAETSAGSGTGTASGIPVNSTAQAKLGTHSLQTTGSNYVSWAASGNVDHLKGCAAWWYRVAATDNFAGCFLVEYDTNNRIFVHTVGSGHLRFTYVAGGTPATFDLTGVTTRAVDTWYFVVARWDQAAHTYSLTVYDTSGGVVDGNSDTTTVTGTWAGAPTVLRFGEWVGTLTNQFQDGCQIWANDQQDVVGTRESSYP